MEGYDPKTGEGRPNQYWSQSLEVKLDEVNSTLIEVLIVLRQLLEKKD